MLARKSQRQIAIIPPPPPHSSERIYATGDVCECVAVPVRRHVCKCCVCVIVGVFVLVCLFLCVFLVSFLDECM